MRHYFKDTYLSIKYFALIFSILFIAVLVVLVSVEDRSIENKVEEIEADELLFVEIKSELVISTFIRAYYDAAYLADNFTLEKNMSDEWDTILKSNGFYNSIKFYDTDKNLVLSSYFSDEYIIDYAIESEESYLDNAFKLEEGQIYISETISVENENCDSWLSVMLCAPISNGDLEGVLVLELNSGSVIDVTFSNLDKTNGTVYIVTDYGFWSSEDGSYNNAGASYMKLAYDFGFYPKEDWELQKNNTSIVTSTGLYTYTVINFKEITKELFGEDSIVLQNEESVVLTLIESDDYYGYYFDGDITVKLFKIFEEKYFYLLMSLILSLFFTVLFKVKRKRMEKIRNFSHYDPLTKVYNRRSGFELLEESVEKLDKHSKVCICFIDINGLKKVNDVLGHHYGDELIVTVADTVKNTIRHEDMLIRMGGDEFLIVLFKVGKSVAESIWARITESFKAINSMENRNYLISVSHGIAEMSKKDGEFELSALITKADGKMYEEKKRINKTLNVIRKKF